MATVYARTLRAAAELLGGFDELRKYLDVPEHSLRLWVDGRATLPTSVFLLAVDLVVALRTGRYAPDE